MRRPYRHGNKLPYQLERTILGLKKEHPGWGAPKIRDKIIRAFPMIESPATSTVHAVRCWIVFERQIVGIRDADHQIWLVSFLDYDLGFFDRVEGRIEPSPNPFAPEQV